MKKDKELLKVYKDFYKKLQKRVSIENQYSKAHWIILWVREIWIENPTIQQEIDFYQTMRTPYVVKESQKDKLLDKLKKANLDETLARQKMIKYLFKWW